LLRIIML